jgi:hypothetical protein
VKNWIMPALLAVAMLGGSLVVRQHAFAQGAAEVVPMDASVVEAPAAPATSPNVAPDPDIDPGGYISEAFDAVRSKNGWLIGSALVVLLSWLLRFGVRRRTSFLAWFATDRGGVALTAIVATFGGFAHATAAGTSPGWPFLLEVVEVWLGAIGMYVAARRLVSPKDNVKFPKAGPDPTADFSLGGGKGGGYP